MKGKIIIFWAAFVLIAIIRIIFSFNNISPDLGECLKQNIYGEGVLVKEAEKKENSQLLIIRPNFIKSSDKNCINNFLIRLNTDLYPIFSYGDTISFEGKIYSPMNFKSGSGRTFDYKSFR